MCFLVFNSYSNRDAEVIAINDETMVPKLVKVQSVSKIPMAGNIEAWNIIAPVMLPRARVSFSLDIQITLLNFSGNSVAIGVIIIAKTKAGTPNIFDIYEIESTNFSAPTIISVKAIAA